MYSVNFSKTGGPEVLKYEKLSISEPKENEVLISDGITRLKTLKPYFKNKSMFKAAFYALLTVIIIVGIIMKLFQIYYDKYLPENKKEIFIYLVISFIVGYVGDILIYKWDIFPRLKTYYRVVGKGLWGAIAIVFSVFMSLIYLYIYQNYNIWTQKLNLN